MDALFHFLFPVIAALAAKVHIKHKLKNILIIGVVTLLIDLDHFIGLERATFHNVFITILLPLMVIILSFSLKTKYNFKGFSMLLLIFLSSHLVLDLFSEGPVALFYPFSNSYSRIDLNIMIPIESKFTTQSYLITTIGIGILIYFIIIILPCLFLDDIIEIMEKKHESFRKAIKELFKSKYFCLSN